MLAASEGGTVCSGVRCPEEPLPGVDAAAGVPGVLARPGTTSKRLDWSKADPRRCSEGKRCASEGVEMPVAAAETERELV